MSLRTLSLRKSIVSLMLVLAIVATSVGALFAQDVTPYFTDPGWQASYWNNPSLSGAATLQRFDSDLNFNWGYSSPDPSLPVDRFSARWTRYIDTSPGTYRFTASSDDGVRLWVDGQLLIDLWYDHPTLSKSADVRLERGNHLVQVEYYDNLEAANIQVIWQFLDQPRPTPTPTPAPPPANSWRAEYFNNITLAGTPALVRNDAVLDFGWGNGSPAPGVVTDDYFSVRWLQNLNLSAGNYRFTLAVDDGARLFINGRTLIDAWKDQGSTQYSGDIYLPGGSTTVQLEYYEKTGAADVRLRWQPIQPGVGNGQWAHYRAEGFNVEFDYPANWQLQGSEVPIFEGSDGFLLVEPVVAGSLDEYVNQVLGDRTYPYGTDPDVEETRIDGQAGRLIMPSADQPARLRNQAVLVVTLPKPLTFAYDSVVVFQHVSFRASTSYIRRIAETVRIINKQTGGNGNAVIVDDSDSTFARGGLARGWGFENEGYGSRLTWTQNNDWARPQYNWGRWYPSLRAGRYEVFVYIPDRFSTTSNAVYWVSHAGGFTKRLVNQNNYSEQWVSLGIYNFQGTAKDYLSLSDVTGERYLSRLVVWDAAKWEAR